MAKVNATLNQLRKQSDAAWTRLSAQTDGLEPYLDRSDAPGEWTAREVLSHVLFDDGWQPRTALSTFSVKDFPTFDINPGETSMTPARKAYTLGQFVEALERQKREVFDYLGSLPEGDLHARKLRIPLFKQFMGTDEITLAMFTGAMFDFHWQDHAGQLAKIRRAVGLPDAA
jgi:hypothetical protein